MYNCKYTHLGYLESKGDIYKARVQMAIGKHLEKGVGDGKVWTETR
jgi:hypothetical protein